MKKNTNIVYRILRKLFREFKNTVSSPFYHYYCPVCNSAVKQFDISILDNEEYVNLIKLGFKYDYSDFETLNALNFGHKSYKCNAMDRERLIALYIKVFSDKIFINKNGIIVDFAPHDSLSRFIKKIKPANYEYRTADKYMDDVNDKVDIQSLPYKDDSVDLFICSHVLEHVDNDRKAMSELFRILKQNGQGILLVPILKNSGNIIENNSVSDPNEQIKLFGGSGHFRLYNRDSFVNRLESAGFRVKLYGIDDFGAKTFKKCGISVTSVLYVVSKHNNFLTD